MSPPIKARSNSFPLLSDSLHFHTPLSNMFLSRRHRSNSLPVSSQPLHLGHFRNPPDDGPFAPERSTWFTTIHRNSARDASAIAAGPSAVPDQAHASQDPNTPTMPVSNVYQGGSYTGSTSNAQTGSASSTPLNARAPPYEPQQSQGASPLATHGPFDDRALRLGVPSQFGMQYNVSHHVRPGLRDRGDNVGSIIHSAQGQPVPFNPHLGIFDDQDPQMSGTADPFGVPIDMRNTCNSSQQTVYQPRPPSTRANFRGRWRGRGRARWAGLIGMTRGCENTAAGGSGTALETSTHPSVTTLAP